MNSIEIYFVTMKVMMAIVFVILFIIIFDAFTMRSLGTEELPCIDKNGDEFLDQMCDKEIWCTTLGIMDNKCSDVERRDSKQGSNNG